MPTQISEIGFKSACAILRAAMISIAIGAIFTTMLAAQDQAAESANSTFPDTAEVMDQVEQDQKRIESLLGQYTFTDKITTYTLGKDGKIRSQHTDTYYITPTAYEFFSLHISHDGKALSQLKLAEQEKKIEKQIQEDERKAKKNGPVHPKEQMLFADIISRSNFTPLRWEEMNGLQTIVYTFKPKSPSHETGSLTDRIAGDLKGKMWVSPEEKEVVRIEFSSVSSLSLGMGLLGKVKEFQGFTEQHKIHGEIWMPARQEYVASGRELTSRFHVREVSEFSEYIKATTDVLQQIRVPNDSSRQPVPQ